MSARAYWQTARRIGCGQTLGGIGEGRVNSVVLQTVARVDRQLVGDVPFVVDDAGPFIADVELFTEVLTGEKIPSLLVTFTPLFRMTPMAVGLVCKGSSD
jgi:hypothetical protein